jgi:hypothetical protein
MNSYGAHIRFGNRTKVLVLNDWCAKIYREGDGRPTATASNDEYEKRKPFGVPSVYLPTNALH